MKKLFTFLLLSTCVLSIQAQKIINDINAEKRSVPAFHAIVISGGIDLYLSQGAESVAVSAASTEIRDRIMTEVKDGVLKIWYEPKSKLKIEWGNRKMKAYVSAQHLDRLNGSGGSDIHVEGTFRMTNLALTISGGSDFGGNLELNEMDIHASGGSDVSMSGKVEQLTIEVSGGSDFNGYNLSADYCNVKAHGGSDVHITVNKELSANASGGSDVYYKGSGLIRDLRTNSSNIKKISK